MHDVKSFDGYIDNPDILRYNMSGKCKYVHRSVINMDSLDKKLIDLLSVDAKQSSEKLGRQLNVVSHFP